MLVVYAVSLKPFLNGGQSVMALETVDDLLAVDHFRFTCYKGGSTHALLKVLYTHFQKGEDSIKIYTKVDHIQLTYTKKIFN